MKGLSIEEKAKAYDEAIEKARKLATDLPNGRNDRLYHVWDLESIFPELVESEDERIKNEIIAFVEQSIHRGGGTPIPEEQETKWIAWLEKQGEQKQYDIDVLEKHITKDSISELAHTVIVRNGWEIVDAKEQNPVWSEEDEYWHAFVAELLYGIEDSDKEYETKCRKAVNWLKSLKERIGG